jgi:hypothetical protein
VSDSARAPGLDLSEGGHIVDRLLHVPHLVRIDHEHRAGRTRVLPCERGAAWETRRLGITREVLRVVYDRAYEPAAAQVVREVHAHFHFEVVEAGLDGFFRQLGYLLIRVS